MESRNNSTWVDRLYTDTSLVDRLDDDEVQRLMTWAESRLESVDSDQEAERLLASIRLLNRYAGEGGAFEELFAALRANASTPNRSTSPPDDFDPEITKVYP